MKVVDDMGKIKPQVLARAIMLVAHDEEAIADIIAKDKGQGRGNWGHKGRPGMRGGSSKQGVTQTPEQRYEKAQKKRDDEARPRFKNALKDYIKGTMDHEESISRKYGEGYSEDSYNETFDNVMQYCQEKADEMLRDEDMRGRIMYEYQSSANDTAEWDQLDGKQKKKWIELSNKQPQTLLVDFCDQLFEQRQDDMDAIDDMVKEGISQLRTSMYSQKQILYGGK